MDFKKKLREFLALNRKADGGFTLVELIVVIAILGILAGVGTVGYSGYIKKANQAADRQLVGYINQAYAIACVQNGVNAADTSVPAGLSIGDDGKISNVLDVAELTDAELDAKIESAFTTNYAEYQSVEFKVAKKLNYANGVFTADFDSGISEQIQKLKQLLADSSFGVVELTDLTGDVSSLVSNLSGYLAIDANHFNGSGFETYLDGIGMGEDATNQELANAAVLYLASQSASMDGNSQTAAINILHDGLNGFVRGNSLSGSVIDNLTTYTGSTLASYAMLYATAEAIALQQPGGTESDAYKELQSLNTVDEPLDVLEVVNNVFTKVGAQGVYSYSQDVTNVADDMYAYFEALNVLNSKEESFLAEDLKSDKLYTDSQSINDLLEQLK